MPPDNTLSQIIPCFMQDALSGKWFSFYKKSKTDLTVSEEPDSTESNVAQRTCEFKTSEGKYHN